MLKNKTHKITHSPLYAGELACGLFGIAEDFIEKHLSLDEKFLKNHTSTFYIRSSGESMSPLIENGDILVVDRSLEVKTNTIVALFYNGTPMCKKLMIKNNQQVLHSINRKFKDIFIQDDDEVIFFGRIRGIVRDLI